MSTQSASKPTKKTLPMPRERDVLPTEYGQEEVVSRSSSSPLVETYKTKQFRNEWANDVRFHVSRNLLHLRRFREMSQSSVARAVGTSQSAIARIESGQENITLDTLERLVDVLDGQFYISIQPKECAPMRPNVWWETHVLSRWNLVGYAARTVGEQDQLVVALQRGNTTPGQEVIFGGTQGRIGSAALLEPSRT